MIFYRTFNYIYINIHRYMHTPDYAASNKQNEDH